MEGGKESVIEKNRRKSFFDCEEDLQSTSRDDFAVAQAKASKLMDFVRKEIAGNPATNFHMNDGLYVVRDKEDPTRERVVVPENLRAWVLHMHHNIELAGHQGHKRMIDQIGSHLYWPKDIKRWVRSCSACKKRKTARPMRSGVTRPVFSVAPNHTLAIDIVGPMPESTDGNQWILTMIDVFTRWPLAVPIPSRESRLIATIIYRRWICEKGVRNFRV